MSDNTAMFVDSLNCNQQKQPTNDKSGWTKQYCCLLMRLNLRIMTSKGREKNDKNKNSD